MKRNPTADRGNLAPALRDLLNDSAALALDAKQVHWNVKGPSFSGLHKLFDEIHAAAVDYADLIGERLAQFGIKTRPRPEDSTLWRPRADDSSGSDCVESMKAELSEFSSRLHTVAMAADEAGDVATLDILSEILRGSDKWLWMVESHLGVEGAKFNPHSEAFQPEVCSGCDKRIEPGVSAWLSDRFGGWFCTKACERSLWKSGRPSSLTQSGLDHFGIAKAQGATPPMGIKKRVNPYPVEVIQPAGVQSNPGRRRNVDEDLRKLERAAASGDPSAKARLGVARVRAGVATPPVSPEELITAIRGWWKSKERDWGDLSYDTKFWTPQEWAAKGERFGNSALVNLTSEGGFNRILCYAESREDDRLVEEWNQLIESLGWRWETNACWAFSFYPKELTAKNPRRRNDGASCSKCGDSLPAGADHCPRCAPSIEDMMRSAYQRHEGLRRNAAEGSWFGDERHKPRYFRDKEEEPRVSQARTSKSHDFVGPRDFHDQPVSSGGFQSLGRGKRRRGRSGREENPRRNAVCPTCGATDAYKSPFSGLLDCRVCSSTPKTLKAAFDAAVDAIEDGDNAAFERHATTWAHLLYGSKSAGDAAISEAAAHEGSRFDGLKVMVFG